MGIRADIPLDRMAPGKQEFDPEIFRNAQVVVDSIF
jgi:ornithine cyclodeaminase/alanine dehydrogenase-like protein (mu-crystallin family)